MTGTEFSSHEVEPLVSPTAELHPAREPFHRNRLRCLTDPEQATYTLGASARLDLCIVDARNLYQYKLRTLERSSQLDAQDTVVKVLVDDVYVAKSEVAAASRTPEWHFNTTVDITAGLSMIRLTLASQDRFTAENDIGFMELCVGDLPFRQTIEGWFEVRLPEKLLGFSTDRYAAHCLSRDDTLEAMRSEVSNVEEDFWRTRPPQPQHNEPGLGLGVVNGGEIRLRMRLLPAGDWRDMLYSLALTPPAHDCGAMDQRSRSDWVMQDLYDNALDIRRHGYDLGLMCAFNLITYIMRWRSCVLSSIVLMAFVAEVVFSFVDPHPSLVVSILLGLLSLLMLLMAVEPLRLSMTIGGGNAPLTQDGFELAAAWSDTEHMLRFLERLVEGMQGTVSDPQELRVFASRCFDKGEPTITWNQLFEALGAVEWLTFDDTELVFGTRVLVDDLRRAIVLSNEDGLVDLTYANLDPEEGDSKREMVYRDRIQVRPTVQTIPRWAVPSGVERYIRMIFLLLAKYNKPFCDRCDEISDILTWRNCCVSLAITLLLGGASSGFAWVYFSRSRAGHKVEQAWRLAAEALFSAAIASILVGKARWMAPCRHLALALWRSATLRRDAPYGWAFFEPVERQGTRERRRKRKRLTEAGLKRGPAKTRPANET